MGLMFLVFVPLPYVDASSAWVFRRKWQRAVVGMAGVIVELAGAAIAAIVWANTSTGTVHIIAYNVMFIASISTLFFNANPLLRFDGYYVLSDLIEIPNLSLRSRNYLTYLVKRYGWRLKNPQNPANTLGERIWFVFYGVVSTVYRVFICIQILLFLNDRLPRELFMLVPLLAISAIIAWIIVPVSRLIRYLATSGELARARGRAAAFCFGGWR
jgi:putative peptide zinc metalloprotease protein